MPQLTPPLTISSVEGVSINTKRGPSTIYKVRASDGKEYATFDVPTAQKAQQLVNQQAVISYDIRLNTGTNGQTYENYDLKDIHGGGNGSVSLAVAPASLAAVPTTTIPTAVPGAIPVGVSGAEKDQKITRMAAHKAAAILVGQFYSGAGYTQEALEAFRDLTVELVRHSETGQWAAAAPSQPQQPVPVAVPDIPWDAA